MMKNKLTILWGVILGGSIFIAIHLFKPTPAPYTPPVELEEVETEVIVREIELEFDKSEKGYNQLIIEGDAKLAEGYFRHAILYYQEAVNLNPNSTEPLLRLGHAYLKNNQPAQAKLNFEKALSLDSNSIDVNLALAQANLDLRNTDAAKNIIWELDPGHPSVKYYRGIIFVLAKEFGQAERAFRESDYENSQKFVDAFEKFSHFVETDPIFLDMLLAKALTDVEQYEIAIPFLFDILNRKNNYRDAWIVLGYAYLNTGKSADAIDALLQADVLSPQHPEILFYLGLAYFGENDLTRAINYLESADLAGYVPKDQIRVRLGEWYLLKEQYEHAASAYRAILTVNPKNLEIFIRGVWLNIDKLDNPAEALRLALSSMEEHKEDPMSHNLVGWAYAAVGDYGRAEYYLKSALSMREDFDAAFLNLGWMHEKQGFYEEAKDYYKRAYMLGQGNSIGNRAAVRFNNLTADITSPQFP